MTDNARISRAVHALSRSIKLGQALSIRPDLLPAAYVSGLAKLQDAVKPFPGSQGRAAIESELGVKLDEAFSNISMEPVASASIGQVYRGTIRVSATKPKPTRTASPPHPSRTARRPRLRHS